MIISDQSPDLVKAIHSFYPRVSHQPCTFHKATYLGQLFANKRHHHRIITDALHIFETTTATEVRKRLRLFCGKWWSKEPKAVRNLVKGFEHCLVYLEYPDPILIMLKTNNPIERYAKHSYESAGVEKTNNSHESLQQFQKHRKNHLRLNSLCLNQQKDMPKFKSTQFA